MAKPNPIEWDSAIIPMVTGAIAAPNRPILYDTPTAVPRICVGKLSLIYVPLTPYGAP